MDLSELDLGRFKTTKERKDFLVNHWQYALERLPAGVEKPTFVVWLQSQGIKGRYEFVR